MFTSTNVCQYYFIIPQEKRNWEEIKGILYTYVLVMNVFSFTSYRNRASNEMVTPVGISIDSCYDVVRLENIAKSSLNQYVPPTPFNEDKTVSTYQEYILLHLCIFVEKANNDILKIEIVMRI